MALNKQTQDRLNKFIESDAFSKISPEQQKFLTDQAYGLGYTAESPDRMKHLARLTSMAQQERDIAEQRSPKEVFGLQRLKDIDDPYGLYKTLREGIALPGLSLLNAASLGNIKNEAKRAGETYPEQEKTNFPARALSGIAATTGLIKSPVLKGLSLLKAPRILGVSSPIAQRIAQSSATGALRGGVGGAITAPAIKSEKDSELSMRAKQALAGAGIGGILGGIGQSFQELRQAPGNKVKAIRSAFMEHMQSEYDKYDDAINKLAKENGTLQGDKVLENIEQKLVDRGLFGSDGKIINRPLSSAESKLVKSYNRLFRKYSLSKDGTLTTKDVIEEYQSIKGPFRSGKVNAQQRSLRDAADDIFDSAREQIDSDSFRAANANYARFKQDQALIDKRIQLFPKSPEMTERGEKFLTRDFGKTSEARATANAIKSRTGQTLRGAENISKLGFLRNPGVQAGIGVAGGLGILGTLIARAIRNNQGGTVIRDSEY